MAEEIVFDAPYEDVEHALRASYAMETACVCDTASTFRELLGGVVSEFVEGLTMYERVAQGSMTIAFAKRHLTQMERSLLDAVYKAPFSIFLSDKVLGCKLVSQALSEDSAMSGIDRWYLYDATLTWVGLRPVHNEAYWRDRLRKDPRTLRRWRNGDGDKPGAMTILDRWLKHAIDKLNDPMHENGLTRYAS